MEETEVLPGDSLETVLKKTLSRTQETLRRTAYMLDEEAVERAKAYLSGALAAMLDLGHGSGPMDHMFDLKSEFIGGTGA